MGDLEGLWGFWGGLGFIMDLCWSERSWGSSQRVLGFLEGL